MIPKTIRKDNASQRWGRGLIIVGSCLLALLLGNSMNSGIDGPMGTGRWWAAVLKMTFFRPDLSVAAWTLLAVFVFGSVLNLWGLKEAIRRANFTIGWLMAVVALVALICVGLRVRPVAGVGLFVGASVSPAFLIEKARRSDSRNAATRPEDQR